MQGNYRTEFRDYDGELPVIDGMKDNSWHNDAMPSMINESGTLTLWVNYVNPAWREVGDKLYCLCSNDPAGTSEKVIVETDDLQEVISIIAERNRLADEYVRRIGYDPFKDDPSLTNEYVKSILEDN